MPGDQEVGLHARSQGVKGWALKVLKERGQQGDLMDLLMIKKANIYK